MSLVQIYTQNSVYTFNVGAWHSDVRGGILPTMSGHQGIQCLPPDVICEARDSGDLADLIGRSLRFKVESAALTSEAGVDYWTPITTSPVVSVNVVRATS